MGLRSRIRRFAQAHQAAATSFHPTKGSRISASRPGDGIWRALSPWFWRRPQAADLRRAIARRGPHLILIIRHAEKTGSKTDSDLLEERLRASGRLGEGHSRSLFQARLFDRDAAVQEQQSPRGDHHALGKALHKPVEAKYKNKEYEQLAHKLLTDPRYAGKTVLISWHHGNIPELAHALGAKDAPAKWGDKVFDRVWQLTYEKGMPTWKELPENALPGDTK